MLKIIKNSTLVPTPIVDLKLDSEPRQGSTDPVTSDGVKSAIDGAVGDAAEALQEQIDDIAEKAGSGYIPKGEASVATLNSLSGQENGWLYTMTDAGTLTDGSLAVVAGDTVAWDATNSVWYKAMDYAPAQYGTNKVHNLPTTITAFRTGDVIPVDGPDGTAKMPKDDLLRVTAQNALGSIHSLSDTATEADLVAGNYFVLDGSAGTKKLPANSVAPKSTAEKSRLTFRFYNPSKVVVESSESPFTIYFTYNETLILFGSIGSSNKGRSVNISDLATELGVSLVTSPNGVTNCVEIASGYSLVYNVSDSQYHLRTNSVGSIEEGDIVLLFNNRGCVGYGELLPEIIDFSNGYYNSISVYGSSGNDFEIEETNTSSGSIYFKGTIVFNGRFTKTWSMADIATALGVSLVTSPSGISGCLEIEDGKALCVSIYGAVLLLVKSKIKSQHKIVAECERGQVVEGCLVQYYLSRFSDIEKKLIGTPFSLASDDVAEAIADVAGEYDTFLFFSDAHCMSYNGMFDDADQNRVTNFVNDTKKIFVGNAINKAFCGGDLLSTGDTQVEALKKLRYFAGLVRREFDCYLAVGNHDTNYLGKLDSESSANTGLLSNAQQVGEMINIGSTYYVVSSHNTDYYILDTGTDLSGNMTSFRWEQIDWLAGKLQEATNEHAVVIMHIYSRGTEDSSTWSANITQMATNLQSLLGALNSRSSVTLNGQTYDFTDATQKVAVIMCGHTHYDYVDYTGNIPVVCITRTFHNKLGKAVDVCVLDYAASKLKCIRFGGFGTNREISIVT